MPAPKRKPQYKRGVLLFISDTLDEIRHLRRTIRREHQLFEQTGEMIHCDRRNNAQVQIRLRLHEGKMIAWYCGLRQRLPQP